MPDRRDLMRSSDDDIATFIDRASRYPAYRDRPGRLVFALDATASRQPTWDRACQLQAEMFETADRIGRLSVQLVWYRGLGEFQAEPWTRDSGQLVRRMSRVLCAGGLTQIGRVLNHVIQESRRERISALVFVGDCVEEKSSELYDLAGQLGLLGIPAFLFHEGDNREAARILHTLARLTGGACCAFDHSSADQLKRLLSAAAVYAVGGKPALQEFGRRNGDLIKGLLEQMD